MFEQKLTRILSRKKSETNVHVKQDPSTRMLTRRQRIWRQRLPNFAKLRMTRNVWQRKQKRMLVRPELVERFYASDLSTRGIKQKLEWWWTPTKIIGKSRSSGAIMENPACTEQECLVPAFSSL
mmetsp:Transcript_86556/g.249942  ORF Transcript_86556/g.249942 Transcript_86556/m.249942 type:complete len:124 (-) Transcript_86556:822-1193(-)